jgi:hypothetical protein
MEAKGDHLAVVIGASRTAEELRRYLVTCGTPCSGVANHLRGLRRSLLLGRPEMAVVCVALNRLTLERHGEELRRLVRDLRAFPTPIHTIGLVPPLTLMSRVVHLGCDIYVSSAGEARDVLGLLRRHRRRDHVTARRKELLEMWAEGEAGSGGGGRLAARSPRITGWRLWRLDQTTDFSWCFCPSSIRRPAAGIGRHEAPD